jgi:predicted HTH transcriptional regulator
MSVIERFCDLLTPRDGRPAMAKESAFSGAAVSDHLANLPIRRRSRFHLYSVREAVANLLVHRDLGLRDVPTRINIYDSSIEVVNARRTNGFVPPAARAIRYGITQRLNPQIAAIYNRRE